jgi:hypothetical protein
MHINSIKPGMMVNIDEICPRTLDRYDICPAMKERFLGKKGVVKKIQPQDDKIGAVFIEEFVFASEDVNTDIGPVEKPVVKETKFDPANLF